LEKRRFGKTDMDVTILGFGGAEIGFEQASNEAVKTILNNALDAGLNVIDTAECYMGSEELIGQAVSHRRKDFYLFTKCGHPDNIMVDDWSPNSLSISIDRSLRRLQTDYLDLIQLHSCSEEVLRQGDVIELLQKVKTAGKARYIGYSGDGNAALYAIECGAFDALQTSINIADQEALNLLLPRAREHQIGVIAKRPIANAAWRYSSQPDNSYHLPYWQRLQQLKYDFLNQPDGAAVALRFTLSVPGVHTAIVGTTKPERWRENAAILANGPLPADQFEAIEVRWRELAKPDWVGQE
jgi:aryl-alcohol dehydrogenase-like predicted oxidoreductase